MIARANHFAHGDYRPELRALALMRILVLSRIFAGMVTVMSLLTCVQASPQARLEFDVADIRLGLPVQNPLRKAGPSPSW